MTVAAPTESAAARLFLGTKHVIGQEKARKQLAVLLDRQLMVHQGLLERSSGAIVAGRTGTGKTFLVRSMCRMLGIPFAEANATQYSDVGYAGMDLNKMFMALVQAAAQMIDEQRGGKRLTAGEGGVFETTEIDPSLWRRQDLDDVIELAQTGVILLDEADKWLFVQGQKADPQSRNVGKKLQAELLKMVEGSTEFLSEDSDELGVAFDTTRVLILYCGAFVGLPAMAGRRLNQSDSGENPEFWSLIGPEDFVRYGMIPELAGRLSTIIFLRPLRPEHLATIMRSGGLIDEYRTRFAAYGVDWDVDEGGMLQLAHDAIQNNMGARALEHVLWTEFNEALFEAATREGPGRVVFRAGSHRAQVF